MVVCSIQPTRWKDKKTKKHQSIHSITQTHSHKHILFKMQYSCALGKQARKAFINYLGSGPIDHSPQGPTRTRQRCLSLSCTDTEATAPQAARSQLQVWRAPVRKQNTEKGMSWDLNYYFINTFFIIYFKSPLEIKVKFISSMEGLYLACWQTKTKCQDLSWFPHVKLLISIVVFKRVTFRALHVMPLREFAIRTGQLSV